MKFKYILLISLLSALIVVAGCGLQPGKGFAGKAIGTPCDSDYDCGRGETCSRGICTNDAQESSDSSQEEISETEEETGFGGSQCTDSDGGKNFIEKGQVEVNGEIKEDFCYTFKDEKTPYLFEAICGDTKFGNDPYYYVQKKCEEAFTGVAANTMQCLDGKCVKLYNKLEYSLLEKEVYVADVKLGGVAYPFSFDPKSQILTFKYWGDGDTYELLLEKESTNYVGNFKLGGLAYPIKIIWGKQPPVIILENWPNTETLEYLLKKKNIYQADVKLGGVAYPFSFDSESKILTFKYWEDGNTYELLLEKESTNYVGNFKLGGLTYPIKIIWDKQPPVMILENWSGT